MIRSLASRWRPLLAAGLVLLAVAGCGDDDDEAPARASLRAVHASSDTGPVDVLVDGARAASALAFRQASGFSDVDAGTRRIVVAPAGTSTAAIDVSPTLTQGRRYTAVAVGSSATGAPAGQRLGAVLVEDEGNAPAAGNAKLRVLHAAPAVAAVDVYLGAPGAALPAAPTVPNLAFRAFAPAAARALEVPAGSYQVRITPAGQPASVVYDSGGVPLAAGDDLLLAAIPAAGTASPVALLAVPASGAATEIGDARAAVRVAHFAPNVPAVDVFLRAPAAANGADNRVAAGVAFPAATGYLPAAPGAARASVALAGSTTEAVGLDATLTARRSASVFAAGLAGGTGAQALQLLPFADDRTPAPGQAKVRVIHLSPDAPPVDVVALDAAGAIAARLVQGVAYPAAAGPLTVPPGSYTLAVVPAGATTPVLPSAAGVPLALAAGDVITVVAAGCLNVASGPCAGGGAFRFVTLRDD